MKKLKAISALITTILIIVVSVILVTIILSWGKDFTTSSVNKADNIINEKCDKAMLRIVDCTIITDGNIVFQVKNTSNNFDFESTDQFKVAVFNDSGTMDAEQDLVLASGTWQGLNVGDTVMAKVAPTTSDLTSNSGSQVNVTVRSTICPLASTTTNGCHR
ncbi:MAG: hypothetical protein WCX82_00875 [archaeon]|jgi:hypothetical protein